MTTEDVTPRRCPCRICIRLWGALLNWRYARHRLRYRAQHPHRARQD